MKRYQVEQMRKRKLVARQKYIQLASEGYRVIVVPKGATEFEMYTYSVSPPNRIEDLFNGPTIEPEVEVVTLLDMTHADHERGIFYVDGAIFEK